MSTALRDGISALFRRLAPPNAADAPADADLLARFVRTHDEPAFAELVRRHGAMVLSVCRRRLGTGPDADDAYQVAFLALARDARKVRGESVAGWLYRVAHLSALKLNGRVHRHKPDPLTTDPAAPMTREPDADLKAVIDEELAALPDRFRGVAVLCLVEGLTNTEAADRLGIPKGTVDSRLSTAKAKLRDRLLKRGVAAASLLSLETALSSATATAAGRAAALAAELVPLALNYASGTPLPGSEHLTTLANGVKPTMNALSIKWLAALTLTTGLLGGVGYGVYHANAGDDTPQAQKKADPKKPPKADEKPQPKGELRAERVAVKNADEVMTALQSTAQFPETMQFEQLTELINEQLGLIVRIDTAAFVRRSFQEGWVKKLLAKELRLKSVQKLPVADVLREVLAQLTREDEGEWIYRLSYRIKGNQILIVPEYLPVSTPGFTRGADEPPHFFLKPADIMENIYGEPVTVRYKSRPLPEVIEDLQDRTGANIVLKPQGNNPAEVLVTANFNDTRLLTVLKIVGDMCDLKPVVIDNVYYLTDEASAAKLQKQVDRDLFGEPAPAVPSGFVTDGYKLFPKTADMKPVEDAANGLGGGGLPFKAKPVPAPEKKDK